MDRLLKDAAWMARFLGLAEHVSQWSKDPSTKVGAVLVRPDKSVASLGYNGFPKGMSDSPELYADRDIKYSRIVHAEMNALIFAHSEDVSGCTLFTWPFAPCDRCAITYIQAGVRSFVFPEATGALLERWSEQLARTKNYILEVGGEFIEAPVHLFESKVE